MRLEWFATALLLTSTCLVTCEGNVRKKILNVLTYNTRLHSATEEVDSTKEARKKKLIRSLKKSSADLVCLQQVHFGSDVEDIVNSVQKQFPYSFSGIHSTVNDFPQQSGVSRQPPCDYTRLVAYVTCLGRNRCFTYETETEVLNCVYTTCSAEANDIFQKDSQECQNCLPFSSSNIFECAAEGPVDGGRQMNNGGLLLLVKRNIRDASYVDYHPTIKTSLSRGYLKAEIEDFGHVFCTHMSSTGTAFYAPGLISEGFASYADVHTYQTRTLIRSLRGIQPAIILGDFNTGLALKSSHQPIYPESYVRLLKRFTTRPAVDYTWRDPKDKSKQYVGDHVFVKNLVIRKTKRIFLQEEGQSPLSDRVGVQSVVKTA